VTVMTFVGAMVGAMMAAYDSSPKTADAIYRALDFLDAGMPLSCGAKPRGGAGPSDGRDNLTRCDRDGIDGDSCSWEGLQGSPRLPQSRKRARHANHRRTPLPADR
jgi:hypothetical protein